ncbi:glucose-1-phosphate thymidyltransferase [Oceanithermus profundus DSM 14977]|uniref:Glucose-1-phosphate thymidyltransferase n=1 Tax=Oceanithermus profundus (strain DSM 14977 / NBRC 100410 / VKM B-2274 / 506) TaxID=670487 RepID=E4U5D5_OCEP5|nr:glucose-1-phosphate thymidylyltransferase [Oceanithermus profundus]ADR37609.1 glucose-1-phosphate thymidyltransferase [Oceanithermus profundus DSM 14977]
MKGLILAAGRGTRLRPLTHTRPKPVIRVAGRPIIHYALENLKGAGVHEIGVVVSPDTHDDVRAALNGMTGVEVAYILQERPQGLAHAVSVAREWLEDDPFVLYLGDNLFERGIAPFVRAHAQGGPAAVVALARVEDPRQFGVAEVAGRRILRLVEKPERPPSDLAVAGVYVFDARIHGLIEGLEPSARGEYEITDAIQRLIDGGHEVQGLPIEGWWKDTGRAEDLLDANRLLLAGIEPKNEGRVEESRLIGRVVIEEGATVLRSTVMGPALIAAGSRVEDAFVGPFTAVGPGAEVRGSEVEYSIVADRAVIENVPTRLQECVIGVGARVTSRQGLPRAHRLVLGDESRVEIG